MLSAVGAAVHQAAGFVAMADDAATAMLAFRSELVDGALKAIEVVGNPVYHDFQRLVVFIAADLASGRSSVKFGALLACQFWFENPVRLLFVSRMSFDHTRNARPPREAVPSGCAFFSDRKTAQMGLGAEGG